MRVINLLENGFNVEPLSRLGCHEPHFSVEKEAGKGDRSNGVGFDAHGFVSK